MQVLVYGHLKMMRKIQTYHMLTWKQLVYVSRARHSVITYYSSYLPALNTMQIKQPMLLANRHSKLYMHSSLQVVCIKHNYSGSEDDHQQAT